MEVTKKSLVTGKVTTRNVRVTQEELDRHAKGELAHIVWPRLSRDDLKFLIYGISPEEDSRINGEYHPNSGFQL